jgi:hypothetical protein
VYATGDPDKDADAREIAGGFKWLVLREARKGIYVTKKF